MGHIVFNIHGNPEIKNILVIAKTKFMKIFDNSKIVVIKNPNTRNVLHFLKKNTKFEIAKLFDLTSFYSIYYIITDIFLNNYPDNIYV